MFSVESTKNCDMEKEQTNVYPRRDVEGRKMRINPEPVIY